MKKQTGIWIDGSKAIVIALKGGKETVQEIASEIETSVHHAHEGDKGSFMGARHINNEKKIDERKKHQVDQFLDKVINQVKEADELFVMGPASLKLKLKTRIEENHLIKNKLKGVETSAQMTINQCVEKVKTFYKESNSAN
ncbi:MAG: hypothetical protein PSX36_05100 [bacterium]|nr:hypothetical protein [bacterium]